MSIRSELPPQLVIEDGDMSDDIESSVTIISKLSMISYDVSWAGSTPIGTLAVQVSNTYSLYANGQVNNPGTWNSIDLLYLGTVVQSIPVSGNTGSQFINVSQMAGYAIKLIYTRTSGSGLLQATVSGKVM